MAAGLPVNLSCKNSIITITCVGLALTFTVSGAGGSDWFGSNDIEIVDVGKGLDNTPYVFLKNAVYNGKLTLLPLTTTYNNLVTICSTQSSTLPLVCSVKISDITGLWNVTYPQVVFTSGIKGFELADKLKDIVFNWKALIDPIVNNYTNVLSIATQAISIIESV